MGATVERRETVERVKLQVEKCLQEFRRNELKEESLNRILEAITDTDIDTKPKRQDLLYLQAGSTSIASGIHGMSIVKDGQIINPEPDKFPYNTVLEAIRDGWRIIQFPNLSLLMDESRTYGLGCEFILEKWG